MPDIDTGEQGTCMVYCVSLQLDANHDGNMDLSFTGTDATSASSPAVVWVNDNYDRGHAVDGNDYEQDDLGAANLAQLPTDQQVPDFEFTTNGQPAIPGTRDLEDYFRMWTPGVAALMQLLPSNYSVQLTLTGGGQIRIFQAIEPNGGTNYLFDETTASSQVANSTSLYVGLLTSNSPVILSAQPSFNEHFIFCGAQSGSAQIDLQILDGNQNVIADASAYLQINNIKEMYERWTVGDNPNIAPANVAVKDMSDLPPLDPAFAYPAPQDTNTPYILFVHGWNMERWEKDRFAEAAFKRLYWQGYNGRFGIFRWPTHNGFGAPFSGSPNTPLNDPRNYDNSESNAWASATGLLNKLSDLDALYPGHVYMMAHSMGNVVAGEALRLAGTNHVANTYIAMQGAISAHCYDASTPSRWTFGPADMYANYWTSNSPCYFNATAGAGTYVNFYNANDWALNAEHWQLNQDLKPDSGYTYNPYFGLFERGNVMLYMPTNTYEVFSYADPARSFALGAQQNVNGAFKGAQVNLPSVWPPDTHPQGGYQEHVWHSAEFRSDNPSRALFWNTVLGVQGFDIK
jgi:hypothetical protein